MAVQNFDATLRKRYTAVKDREIAAQWLSHCEWVKHEGAQKKQAKTLKKQSTCSADICADLQRVESKSSVKDVMLSGRRTVAVEDLRDGNMDLAELRRDGSKSFYSFFTPQWANLPECVMKLPPLVPVWSFMCFVLCAFKCLVFRVDTFIMMAMGPHFAKLGCPPGSDADINGTCGLGSGGAFGSVACFAVMVSGLLSVVQDLEDPFDFSGYDDILVQFRLERNVLVKVCHEYMADCLAKTQADVVQPVTMVQPVHAPPAAVTVATIPPVVRSRIDNPTRGAENVF